MFPPPPPWTAKVPTEPDHEYVAFTSRFAMKSWLTVPAFMAWARSIRKQANQAPGVIGWSLAFNLATKDFYTLSAWVDGESLRTFVQAGEHAAAMGRFASAMRQKSTLVRYTVKGNELPLTWDDALTRQAERERAEA